jgi:hypothetical protein
MDAGARCRIARRDLTARRTVAAAARIAFGKRR